MRRALFIFLLTAPLGAFAQLSLERQLTSRMQKGKWKSAEESLRKVIRKDTLHAEARFLLSRFYFSDRNPSRNIDSAYQYTLLAMRDFSATPAKEKDRLKRVPLDSLILIGQRKKIDSAAFERAKALNTEKAYADFLEKFTLAVERASAIELRDEVAFVDALKVNTYSGYYDYLQKYPASLRAREARERYEKGLYYDKTRDGKLRSFENFYRDYPTSPYRRAAETNIFEIFTASGRHSLFSGFIAAYPSSSFQSRAKAILYHLSKEEELKGVDLVLNDSLLTAKKSEQGYWVPVLRNGKFGFIDQHGTEMISPQFASVLPEYLCGNVKDDHLVVGGGIIGRNGQWIFKGPIREAVDIGSGYLKINSGDCIHVVHKSGFSFPDSCYGDAKMIAHHFVAVKEHLKWGLITLTGRVLLTPLYDDIGAVDELVIFMRNGKKTIVTIDEVGALADQATLPGSRVFDDVQRLGQGTYLVRNGSLEGVLNERLEFRVPLNRQVITKAREGFILKRDQKYYLAAVSDKLANKEFSQVQFYGNWIKLQTSLDFQLFDLRKKKMLQAGLDSLWFENELAFASKNDSLKVYLKSGLSLDFDSDTKVSFIKSADSTDYFYIPERNKKTVFDTETGKKLFTFEFDEIECIGQAFFLVSQGNKKGLLSDAGKILLPIEYAAIVPAGAHVLSLLKERKFGLYHIRTRKLLKPGYDRNLIPISLRWIAAYKETGYGFIDWDSKPQSKFEFEEVRPWNDTSVLVKKNFQWMICKTPTGKVVMGNILDFRLVSNTKEEIVAIIHQDIHYGIASNKRGEIIPANFSDVINVGSEEEPLYFAEKNVEEAGIEVVIYYDKNGKLVRKQVYEEDEYEKIYCADN
jgi:hypothetical protein